jgi:hypothetical protein
MYCVKYEAETVWWEWVEDSEEDWRVETDCWLVMRLTWEEVVREEDDGGTFGGMS